MVKQKDLLYASHQNKKNQIIEWQVLTPPHLKLRNDEGPDVIFIEEKFKTALSIKEFWYALVDGIPHKHLSKEEIKKLWKEIFSLKDKKLCSRYQKEPMEVCLAEAIFFILDYCTLNKDSLEYDPNNIPLHIQEFLCL